MYGMKEKRIEFRCSQVQYDRWSAQAKSENRSLSNWMACLCDNSCLASYASSIGAPNYPQLTDEANKIYQTTGWGEYNKAHDLAALKTRQETGIELSPAREKALDALAAKIGVTKGGEILGTSFANAAKNVESLVKSDACNPRLPEKPKGHTVKCSCVKCQQAKGWRG